LFNSLEQVEMRRLVEAGIGARAALVAMEGVMGTEFSPDLRPIIANTLHPLLECVEGATNALGNLTGAICERDERAKVARRLDPREVFVAEALAALNDAIDEGEEGLRALDTLTLLLPSNLLVKASRVNMVRTLARLRLFDQSLPYEFPLAWPNMDPLLERDMKTNLWRSKGQYLYDALAALIHGYSADPTPLLPADLYLLQTALEYGWKIQDDLGKVTLRVSGIPYTPGENGLAVSFWTLAGTTSNRWQFCMTNTASLLNSATVEDHPLLQLDAIYALAKGTDAWKRAEYVLGLLPVMAGWMTPGKAFGT